MNLNDVWLKIQNDDVTAFEVLYYILYPGMCQYASQLLGDRCTAEETVQDVFLKIWIKRKDIFSKNGSIKNYLFRLVHNQCLDIIRRNNTRKEIIMQVLSPEMWANISEKYEFDNQLIEQMEAEDTAMKIQQIIKLLPARCREIFIKSRFENRSNKEIATEMNLSENTVKTQIFRALKKIKEQL